VSYLIHSALSVVVFAAVGLFLRPLIHRPDRKDR
jgi:hypothetical protein